MATIEIDELFKTHETNNFKDVHDEILLDEKYFLLQAVYRFELKVRSEDYHLFRIYEEAQEGIIFKMNNQYYLTSIDGCDGYRDNRGTIYALYFDEQSLLDFLDSQHIHNQLDSEVNVMLEKKLETHMQGLTFYIENYSEEKTNYLMFLGTSNYDDYYPSGKILFNDKLLVKAKPYIEQHNLNKQINDPIKSGFKVKL